MKLVTKDKLKYWGYSLIHPFDGFFEIRFRNPGSRTWSNRKENVSDETRGEKDSKSVEQHGGEIKHMADLPHPCLKDQFRNRIYLVLYLHIKKIQIESGILI